MNTDQVWNHVNKKYKNGTERATFLYEVFYNRSKLVSRETYSSICNVLNTPICTGVVFGQLANQIAERIQREREERERPRTKEELEEIQRQRRIEWESSYDPDWKPY